MVKKESELVEFSVSERELLDFLGVKRSDFSVISVGVVEGGVLVRVGNAKKRSGKEILGYGGVK